MESEILTNVDVKYVKFGGLQVALNDRGLPLDRQVLTVTRPPLVNGENLNGNRRRYFLNSNDEDYQTAKKATDVEWDEFNKAQKATREEIIAKADTLLKFARPNSKTAYLAQGAKAEAQKEHGNLAEAKKLLDEAQDGWNLFIEKNPTPRTIKGPKGAEYDFDKYGLAYWTCRKQVDADWAVHKSKFQTAKSTVPMQPKRPEPGSDGAKAARNKREAARRENQQKRAEASQQAKGASGGKGKQIGGGTSKKAKK